MKVFDIGLEVYYELESEDIVCLEDTPEGIKFSIVDKNKDNKTGKTFVIFDGIQEVKDILKDYKTKIRSINNDIKVTV